MSDSETAAQLYDLALEKTGITGNRTDIERKLIAESGLFLILQYNISRATDFSSITDAINDYIENGANIDAVPNFYFNAKWYSRQVNGLEESGCNPLVHYILIGSRLRLNPGPMFDTDWYLRTYPDVAARGMEPLADHLSRGVALRRTPIPGFDVDWYLSQYSDVATSGEDPFLHFHLVGWKEGRFPNGLFDTSWYLENNKDVATAGMNPLLHYLRNGHREGRCPNPVFNPTWYRSAIPESAAQNIEPTVHYLRHRKSTGAFQTPEFDGEWYLRTYPDVADIGIDPLVHFVVWGRREERLPRPKAEPRQVKLAPDRSMSTEDFVHFRDAAFNALPPHRAGIILHVLISTANNDPAAMAVTLASLRDACWPSTWHVRTMVAASQDMIAGWPEEARPDNVVSTLEAIQSVLTSTFCNAVLFVGAGDRVDPDIARVIGAGLVPEADAVLFDQILRKKDRIVPVLLPGINPIHILNVDYCLSRFVLRPTLLLQWLSAGHPLDPAAIIRSVVAKARPAENDRSVTHVAAPGVEVAIDPDLVANARRRAWLDRRAFSYVLPGASRLDTSHHRVSIVICSKDNEHLLTQLTRSIIALGPDDALAEIILVLNEQESPYHEQLFQSALWQHEKIKIIYQGGLFNFSLKSNVGARAATGDLLLFLNDDIVPITSDWLSQLIAPFENPKVGVTAPLLVYPNASVQHCGMYASYGGAIGHSMRFARLPEGDFLLMGSCPRNVSVATGAALLIRRSIFEEIGGFEEQLANYIQDVDLSLRIRQAGHDIVLNPRSVLIHMETISIKETLNSPRVAQARGREHQFFMKRWADTLNRGDPYHNPMFDLKDEQLLTIDLSAHRRS